VRYSPTKPVGVDVKQCKIHQEAKLLWQVAGNITMVEINAGNCTDCLVVWSLRTENPLIVANLRPNPIGC
jgi:hypothetical protein